MSLLAPLYLLLGAAAAVPLLLHLLRRRTGTRVEFPAARYLERAEREHSRSLRLRNILLMLLRVALVLLVALAAARPVARWLGAQGLLGRGRGPTAVAIVLDNSLSAGAVVNGRPLLEQLRDAARRVLDESRADDRLVLVTADGRVQGGTAATLREALDRTGTLGGRGDPALALRRAATAVASSGLAARQVVVLTDGQRSAWPAVLNPGDVPVLLWVPRGAPPVNRAITLAEPRPERWTPRGALALRARSSAGAGDSVTYRVTLTDARGGARTLARGTARVGEEVLLRAAPAERGWVRGTVELEPDELPADDVRHFALWLGPAPVVALAPAASAFTRSAAEVLAANGRVALAAPDGGRAVFVGPADELRGRIALVTPPASPVQLGAANRALERAGIPWRFAAPRTDSLLVRASALRDGGASRLLDGATVTLRYPLVAQGAAAAETLATVGREPWVVAGRPDDAADGSRYVLVGSPLVPEATSLPVRAAFVPWLEAMVTTRLSAEGGGVLAAAPGQTVARPAWADAIQGAGGAPTLLRGDDVEAPGAAGSYALLRDGRQVGMLVVNPEDEESVLERWTARELASRIEGRAGRHATVADGDARWAQAAFRAEAARPLLLPLLVAALLLALVEGMVAGAAPRRATA